MTTNIGESNMQGDDIQRDEQTTMSSNDQTIPQKGLKDPLHKGQSNLPPPQTQQTEGPRPAQTYMTGQPSTFVGVEYTPEEIATALQFLRAYEPNRPKPTVSRRREPTRSVADRRCQYEEPTRHPEDQNRRPDEPSRLRENPIPPPTEQRGRDDRERSQQGDSDQAWRAEKGKGKIGDRLSGPVEQYHRTRLAEESMRNTPRRNVRDRLGRPQPDQGAGHATREAERSAHSPGRSTERDGRSAEKQAPIPMSDRLRRPLVDRIGPDAPPPLHRARDWRSTPDGRATHISGRLGPHVTTSPPKQGVPVVEAETQKTPSVVETELPETPAMKVMQHAIINLQAQLNVQRGVADTTMLLSPLSHAILSAPIQPKLNFLSNMLYDGPSDPKVHLTKFSDYMVSVGATDATKCRNFPMTLGDRAHRWFSSLQPETVNTFAQLGKDFLSYFSGSGSFMTQKSRMADIKQDQGEDDRLFLERFDKALMDGDSIDEDAKVILALAALYTGTDLWREMRMAAPRTYTEFRHRAGTYVSMMESLTK